jgi:hypothetical protein
MKTAIVMTALRSPLSSNTNTSFIMFLYQTLLRTEKAASVTFSTNKELEYKNE